MSLLDTDGDALPPAVLRSFDTWVADQLQPLCIEFDDNLLLRGTWGDAVHYGFGSVSVGEPVDMLAPFLIGLDFDQRSVLRFVSDREQRRFHVNVFSVESRRFAVYVNVAQQYDRIRDAQQRSNEVALLYERQNKLIQQLIDASTELDARRVDAESESKRRQRYMHAMSHDLKAPLQSLMLSIETLRADTELSATSMASVERLRGALERQVGVLDRLIDEGRSQIEHEHVTRHPVAIRELMTELSAMFAMFAAEKALRFGIVAEDNLPTLLMLDETKIRRVLINLIGNAIKFTETGFVEVVLAYEAHCLVMRVCDSGPGIRKLDQKRVFEAFSRGQTTEQGSGLGLSIVARLMQLMDGNVELVSSGGGGSTFECRVPAEPLTITPDSQSEALTVLICDDDPDITDLLRQQLKRAGFRVQVCHTAQAALEKTLQAAPDIVVLDATLEVSNGSTVARSLRRGGSVFPILMFSSVHPRLGRKMAIESGCTDFLAKPATSAALIAKIRQLLAAAASRQ